MLLCCLGRLLNSRCRKMRKFKVQLHAATIITDLIIISLSESLCLEIDLMPLFERRKIAKFSALYTIHYNLVPDYLEKHISL